MVPCNVNGQNSKQLHVLHNGGTAINSIKRNAHLVWVYMANSGRGSVGPDIKAGAAAYHIQRIVNASVMEGGATGVRATVGALVARVWVRGHIRRHQCRYGMGQHAALGIGTCISGSKISTVLLLHAVGKGRSREEG